MKRFVDLREAEIGEGRFAWYDTSTEEFEEWNGNMAWHRMADFEADYRNVPHGETASMEEQVNKYLEASPEWACLAPPEEPQGEPRTEREKLKRCVQKLSRDWMEQLDTMGKKKGLLVSEVLMILSAVLRGLAAWGTATRIQHETALAVMKEHSDPFKGGEDPGGLGQRN